MEYKVCTIVMDQSQYSTSAGQFRKNELMVINSAPKWNSDFISLAKFIELGNGQTDIRIFKMPLAQFEEKLAANDYKIVNIENV